MSKLITFAVPCYNSAAYMDHCVRTLLTGGEDVEIILVDDGSTRDDTPAICDRYAAEYPTIVKAIHQENGGHGEGVNQGLRRASGLYYKVVDSDDWLEERALAAALDKLREFAAMERPVDMLIANYVYEHVEDNTRKVMRYTNVFPEGKVFSWNEIGRFRPSQYLLMHSVIYRTQLLRDCGLELPKHTFYVDNIFVYQPLPWVKSMYYMDLDLYRYFIGRADQSVNEKVMVTRVDQQVRVTKLMIESHDLRQLRGSQPKLARYMVNYLSMMMTISSIFLIIDGSPAALGKKTELWEYLRARSPELYHKLKYRSLSFVSNIPGYQGRKLSVRLYRLARKIYKFN
ncbi:glycosyltransferase family 2 protein [uncultured Flavonifractor sp.]|uniref:glycosyltransferase family 2 protein n=1 Tax=uncultured Flavonifractor sp. TaxID=1193534 RepID=UPI00262CE9B3|nr:glycosyltransferase family A protein [uncultured Flavonifractor sp.]